MLVLLAACGADDRVSQPADSDDLDAAPLFGTVWWLDSATADGEPADLSTAPREVRWQVVENGCDNCPDGPHIVGTDACNHFTRNASIDDDTVLWGAYWHSTAAGCSGGFADTMQTFFSTESFSYSISGDELQLSQPASGIELTFRALKSPFGPTDGEVVDDGRAGEVAYRLVFSVGGLSLEQRDTSVEPMENYRMGVGTDTGAVNALRGEIDGRPYLAGIMPAGTTRVVYEPSGGAAEELTLLESDDPHALIVGQFVDDAAHHWDLVAYDADGNELDRLRWRSSPLTTSVPAPTTPATTIQPSPELPAVPPPVEFMSGTVKRAPFTTCWTEPAPTGPNEEAVGFCADGTPEAAPPVVDIVDGSVAFTFPIDDWTFSAAYRTGAAVAVEQIGATTWQLVVPDDSPSGTVIVSGFGPQGDVHVAISLPGATNPPATTGPGALVVTPGQPLGEPQVEPLPGQVRLWVSNQSFEDDSVHLTIAVDGTVVVDEQFHVEGQHNWIPFDIDGLEPGDHQLTATSDTGVDLESSFTTVEDAPRWLVVDYWYYPGEEREFTITETDHAVAFS